MDVMTQLRSYFFFVGDNKDSQVPFKEQSLGSKMSVSIVLLASIFEMFTFYGFVVYTAQKRLPLLRLQIISSLIGTGCAFVLIAESFSVMSMNGHDTDKGNAALHCLIGTAFTVGLSVGWLGLWFFVMNYWAIARRLQINVNLFRNELEQEDPQSKIKKLNFRLACMQVTGIVVIVGLCTSIVVLIWISPENNIYLRAVLMFVCLSSILLTLIFGYSLFLIRKTMKTLTFIVIKQVTMLLQFLVLFTLCIVQAGLTIALYYSLERMKVPGHYTYPTPPDWLIILFTIVIGTDFFLLFLVFLSIAKEANQTQRLSKPRSQKSKQRNHEQASSFSGQSDFVDSDDEDEPLDRSWPAYNDRSWPTYNNDDRPTFNNNDNTMKKMTQSQFTGNNKSRQQTFAPQFFNSDAEQQVLAEQIANRHVSLSDSYRSDAAQKFRSSKATAVHSNAMSEKAQKSLHSKDSMDNAIVNTLYNQIQSKMMRSIDDKLQTKSMYRKRQIQDQDQFPESTDTLVRVASSEVNLDYKGPELLS